MLSAGRTCEDIYSIFASSFRALVAIIARWRKKRVLAIDFIDLLLITFEYNYL